jgi:steroid delta-isomerase-like uncharacterized protein
MYVTSAEENEALVRRFLEIAAGGDPAALREVIREDYIQHSPGVPQGLAGVQQFFAGFFAAFPDMRLTAEDILAAGDRAVLRWTMRGTQRGEFFGIPTTGKPVEIGGIDIWRVEGGKFAEHWDAMDTLGMLQQLGAIPLPGQAA